jgi:hypothetical protein
MPRVTHVALLLIAVVSIGCHRKTHHTANVEITRFAAVTKDETEKVTSGDVEISYVECPGTQIEVIRGNADFVSCMAKRKVGDKVKVEIDHEWTSAGVYKWTVRKVDDCTRVVDPNDEASYAMIRECDDWTVNGAKVGFECKYKPEKHLIAKCPWFRRH